MRVLVAWELGANLGHAAMIAAVLRHLDPRWSVVVSARQPEAFRGIAVDRPVPVIAAPHAMAKGPPVLDTFADDLVISGYGEAATVSRLLSAWRRQLTTGRYDLVMTQFAPSAQIAAKTLGIPSFTFGTGYDIPPRRHPLPLMHDRTRLGAGPGWAESARVAAAGREADILGNLNHALDGLGAAPFPTLADALSGAACLMMPPELDHYGQDGKERGEAACAGPFYSTELGTTARWLGEGPHVFAYLDPARAGASQILMSLARRSPRPDIIVAAPRCTDADARTLAAAGIRVVREPVRWSSELAAGCDLVVSHGSMGLVSCAFASGVPQLVLPVHAENAMLGRRVEALGIGAMTMGNGGHDAGAAHRVLDEPRFREAARAAALPYRGHEPADAARRVVEHMERSLA